MPAEAGIQGQATCGFSWIPASAGMTSNDSISSKPALKSLSGKYHLGSQSFCSMRRIEASRKKASAMRLNFSSSKTAEFPVTQRFRSGLDRCFA
jgi:hypothetical protein